MVCCTAACPPALASGIFDGNDTEQELEPSSKQQSPWSNHDQSKAISPKQQPTVCDEVCDEPGPAADHLAQ